MLRYLAGPQKLVMRQVNRKFAEVIDAHRDRKEERKNQTNTASSIEGNNVSDDSDQSDRADSSSFVKVMADFKQALLNTKLNKKTFASTAGASVKHLK